MVSARSKGDRTLEFHFEGGVMGTGWRRKEGLGIAVECKFILGGRLQMSCDKVIAVKVIAVAGANRLAPFFQPRNIGLWKLDRDDRGRRLRRVVRRWPTVCS